MAVAADWIVRDGVIWTGAGSGTTGAPFPDAMALRDGRVLAVGSAEELAPLCGPETATHSLEGGFVTPGFVDAHLHLLPGGLQLSRVDLGGARSPEEFVQRVADRTRSTPPGSWILGGEWDEDDWQGALPHREWLDRVTPEHPVFLYRSDLHMGVANSRALNMAGIHTDLPDPEYGRIDRDPDTGEPTGILREHAVRLISKVVPPASDPQRWAALRAAALHALAHGVTQVHDMGALVSTDETWRSFRMLRAMQAEGRLPVRVVAGLPLQDWRDVAALVSEDGEGDDRLGWGMVKGFVDGSLGSSTAWFHEPYTDDADNQGGPVEDPEELRAQLRNAVEAGLQPAVHAIGDRANDWLLDVYEALAGAHPGRDLRLRMEHAQHLTPEAIRRLGAGGFIASMQPLHLVDDGRWAERKLGADRVRGSFAFRRLEEVGARLAFGSDWTVAPLDPLGTLRAAVVRGLAAGPDGTERVWLPEERISLETALRAHTLGAAVAGFMETKTGTLEAGKRADFVVLSHDPFQADPDELAREVRVEMTFVDGVMAYRRERDWAA